MWFARAVKGSAHDLSRPGIFAVAGVAPMNGSGGRSV
jgi:hypothetical protein